MCWFTSSLFVDSVPGTTIFMPSSSGDQSLIPSSSSGDQSMIEMVEIRVGLVFVCRFNDEDVGVRPSLLLSSVLVIVSTKFEFDCVVVVADIPDSE